VVFFGGQRPPKGWLPYNGILVSKYDQPLLFASLIGGSPFTDPETGLLEFQNGGDSATPSDPRGMLRTYMLDLRGRTPATGVPNPGGNVDSPPLNPAHGWEYNPAQQLAHIHDYTQMSVDPGVFFDHVAPGAPDADTPPAEITFTTAGGNQPVPNMGPYIGIPFIIRAY
jgi:microcystin-dependent protein